MARYLIPHASIIKLCYALICKPDVGESQLLFSDFINKVELRTVHLVPVVSSCGLTVSPLAPKNRFIPKKKS